VESLLTERASNGPFHNLAGLCRRVDHDKINRRALEAMIKSGALDALADTRCGLMQQLPGALAGASQQARAAAAGQNDMFGLEASGVVVDTVAPVDVPEWPQRVLLNNEKEALGLYLTGHPFDAVRPDAKFFVDGQLGELAAEPAPQDSSGKRDYAQARREVTIAGLLVDIRKRGNRVSIVLDDDTARMEVSLFGETFQEFRHLLVKDEILVVSGALRYDDFLGSWSVNVRNVVSIDDVIERRAKSMVLSLAHNGQGNQLLVKLHDLLLPHRQGHCDVAVQYVGDTAAARLDLGPEWSVRPSRELRDKLGELLGSKNVRLLYTPSREIL